MRGDQPCPVCDTIHPPSAWTYPDGREESNEREIRLSLSCPCGGFIWDDEHGDRLICRHCGTEIEDDRLFCEECTEAEERCVCPKDSRRLCRLEEL